MNDQAVRRQPGPAVPPQDTLPSACQVVWRVLLRRNIAVDPDTAQLVADALQQWFRAAAPAPPPSRPDARPRRRAPAPGTNCVPLF